MEAYLSNPESGDFAVNPQVEMVVVFENPYADLDSVNIIVDGEIAVRGGETGDGFVSTRMEKHEDKIIWGVRKFGGLPPRDIYIQAWCSSDCATVEQRFFVRGAKCEKTFYRTEKNWSPVIGGFVQGNCKVFKSGARLYRDGKLLFDNKRYQIPKECMSEHIDIVRYKDSWMALSSTDNATYVMWPGDIRKFNFRCSNLKITKDLINVQITSNTTAHLPIDYRPSILETELSDWFIIRQREELEVKNSWNVEFGNYLHVWWNQDAMIARHDPDPLEGRCDDRLWVERDIKSKFYHIRITDPTHVIVNGEIFLDTYYPDISYL